MISASLYQHSYQLNLPKIWWFLGGKKVKFVARVLWKLA